MRCVYTYILQNDIVNCHIILRKFLKVRVKTRKLIKWTRIRHDEDIADTGVQYGVVFTCINLR